jgi:predicted AlkP superfamily pyrophosphatase or phosphodiesterase
MISISRSTLPLTLPATLSSTLKYLAPALLAVFVSLSAACTAQAPRAPLILVSIDGFRADYLDRGLTPVMSQLAAEGAVAPQGMRPVFPVLTFPNHYSMVTGVSADRHGIVGNIMSDPAIPGVRFTLDNRPALQDGRWWQAATPIWVSAEKQGLHAATMFWPGSEAAIDGIRPADWRVYDGDVSMEARVDQVLSWLDRPAATRPAFITLYFDTVDTAGHRFGPESKQTDQAIAGVDGALRRLTEGLRARRLLDSSNLLVVSDHGMIAPSKDRVVFLDDLVDLGALEPMSNGGPFLSLTPIAGKESEVKRALTGPGAAAKSAPPAHFQCWPKADLPARFDYGRNPRIPPIICVAEHGWWLSTHALLASKPPSSGAHGYDPDDRQMAALFIAHGPAFRVGQKLAKFNNLDVYPLMAQLLGIRPEVNQGSLATFSAVLTDTMAKH